MNITNQKIAIIGDISNFSLELLSRLAEKKISYQNICMLGVNSYLGREISYGEEHILKFSSIDSFDFSSAYLCIFVKNTADFKKYINKAIAADCKVIDATLDKESLDDQNLIIPGINNIDIKKNVNLFKIPSNITTHLLHCLNDIHDEYGIKKIIVNCALAVSEFNKDAMDELYRQTKSIYANDVAAPVNFSKRIAFNLIPTSSPENMIKHNDIDEMVEFEINKMLGDNIQTSISSFIAPVFIGNLYNIYFELEEEVSTSSLSELLEKNDNISLLANNEAISPVESAGEETIYISKLRSNKNNNFSMIATADNIKNGAVKAIIDMIDLI